MVDLIQVQEDLYGLLMSAPQLATVNIVSERKFMVDSTLEMDAVWQTVRNGCSGNGLLIEEPNIICDSDGVSGPPQQVELSFVNFQNGDGAFTPGAPGAPAGGGLYAAQIEQFLVDILHLQNIGGLGTIKVAGRFSEPAREYGGINARRTKLVMTPKQTRQTPRTAIVLVNIANGQAALTCATAYAQIYYTLDGSFPSNPAVAISPLTVTPATPGGEPVNANSLLYGTPFAVTGGQIIRAAAYFPGRNPGEITRFCVP